MSAPEIALLAFLALVWLVAATLWLMDEAREIRQRSHQELSREDALR